MRLAQPRAEEPFEGHRRLPRFQAQRSANRHRAVVRPANSVDQRSGPEADRLADRSGNKCCGTGRRLLVAVVGHVPLRICLFSGASSLPIRVADHMGMFERAGLAADHHLTRGSRELMEGLLAGRYDVVHAAPDNFIDWRDRTGADIVAWIGGASGPLQLIGSPEVAGVGDLAGRGIAVDSPESGFVSILMMILRAGGLVP